MRRAALMFAILTGGCLSPSEQSDFVPSASAPEVMSPGAMTTEATPPTAPVVERERCPPGDDAVSGHPGKAQAEAGVLSTLPDTLGVPQDTRWYLRSGCEPSH